MTSEQHPLWPRWNAAWNEWSPDAAAGSAAFEDLIASYAEPHRAYHTIEHIEHGLAEIDAIWRYIDVIVNAPYDVVLPRCIFELAWWYHDAVYETVSTGNEHRSAERFFAVVGSAAPHLEWNRGRTQVPVMDSHERSRLLALGERLIEATTHQSPVGRLSDDPKRGGGTRPEGNMWDVAETIAMEWFLDVDLAILGQPVEVYDRYEADIRREYPESIAPAALYVARRTEILTMFLERGTYATEAFQWKYGEQTGRNLARAIARLRAGGADTFLEGGVQ